MTSLYLGVDCGQTHTEAVLLNADGEVLARGVGGPSHRQGADMEAVFAASFREALQAIRALHDWDPSSITAVGLGVTGFAIPGKRQAIERGVSAECPNARIVLAQDSVATYWGASRGQDGAVILAGTGSVAYGRHGRNTLHLGGFGYLCGDEGSGGWIGLSAIRRALHAAERRTAESRLTVDIAAWFGVESMRAVPGAIYAAQAVDVERIARLTRIVSEAAKAGDWLAAEILSDAGAALGTLTVDLLSGLHVPPDAPFQLYRLGGVWKVGEPLVSACVDRVRHCYPAAARD
ncbi:MAG: hypothetical protein K6T83_10385 [Alicyclobacillus sp.]|nr:hypothetical protein [Alicyclobacillus sp.]